MLLGPGPFNTHQCSGAQPGSESPSSPQQTWGQPAPVAPPTAKLLSSKIIHSHSSGLQRRGVSQHGLASLLPLFWLKLLMKKQTREGGPCQLPSGSWLAVQESRLLPV